MSKKNRISVGEPTIYDSGTFQEEIKNLMRNATKQEHGAEFAGTGASLLPFVAPYIGKSAQKGQELGGEQASWGASLIPFVAPHFGKSAEPSDDPMLGAVLRYLAKNKQ